MYFTCVINESKESKTSSRVSSNDDNIRFEVEFSDIYNTCNVFVKTHTQRHNGNDNYIDSDFPQLRKVTKQPSFCISVSTIYMRIDNVSFNWNLAIFRILCTFLLAFYLFLCKPSLLVSKYV